MKNCESIWKLMSVSINGSFFKINSKSVDIIRRVHGSHDKSEDNKDPLQCYIALQWSSVWIFILDYYLLTILARRSVKTWQGVCWLGVHTYYYICHLFRTCQGDDHFCTSYWTHAEHSFMYIDTIYISKDLKGTLLPNGQLVAKKRSSKVNVTLYYCKHEKSHFIKISTLLNTGFLFLWFFSCLKSSCIYIFVSISRSLFFLALGLFLC